MTTIYPYKTLRSWGNDLWTLDGSWKKSPLPRRMTVVRHSSGQLAIHSAIRLRDEDYAELDALGTVALILVPSRLHADEARFYAERYPQAKLFAPARLAALLRDRLGRVDGDYGRWPAEWSSELVALQTNGTKMDEALFWHRPSRTLIVTDLVFHFVDELTGFPRLMMRWNGVLGRLGPSRIFRWFFLADRKALRQSLQPLRNWDFDRIVMSHGTVVELDGKRKLVDSFAAARLI